MKVLMIFDQVQGGLGGKENPQLPLGGKKGPIGAVPMLEPHLKKVEGEVVACLYCGDGYFADNTDEVTEKMAAMVKKMGADVVICGPAYNYKGYAAMCAHLAEYIEAKTQIPTVAAMSQENEEIIRLYKDNIHIVKMPKKGGIGLNDALENICQVAAARYKGQDSQPLKEKYCY